MAEIPLLDKALLYAKAAHNAVGQKRKYTNEPYWTHPSSVKSSVKASGGNEEMQAAALLHDVLEDTVTTPDDLFEEFGAEVTNLVIELTDEYTKEAHPTLNRRERFLLEAERLSAVSFNAKFIKLADIQDNTSSIVENDPKFASIYLGEKIYLLDKLKTNDTLKFNYTDSFAGTYSVFWGEVFATIELAIITLKEKHNLSIVEFRL